MAKAETKTTNQKEMIMKKTTSSLLLALCLGLPSVAVLSSGCAGDRYNRSTGEYIDDKSLSVRVNSALGDNAEYKFSDVSVTTFRGTAQLNGFVNTADQKTRAGEIARQVPGVREVVNNITVKDKM